jgi:V8-like Glu-specific endopeptidase
VRLKDLPEGSPMLKTAKQLPLVDSKTKVYVVGHPRGSGLQISLQDCRLLDIDESERLVHYRTPTDQGSSGSPVFNGKWEVVALHHGGSFKTPRLHGVGNYEANEGISMKSIGRALQR